MSLEHKAMQEQASDDAAAFPAELFDVLVQFDGSIARSEWVCRRLGQGEQGQVFAVRRRDLRPLHDAHTTLVVKLYDRRKSWARAAARDQHDVLALLYKTVGGATCHGWTIRCPAPLVLCEQPLAVVMTEVAGIPLSRLLHDPAALADDVIEPLAFAVAAALDRFWSGGHRVYGELNLDNLLCDLSSRSLSFIDPGVARPARLCLDEKGQWHPASHDLAYLLYAVSTAAVRACALRPRWRARELDLVSRVLGAACQRLAPGPERGRLLDEIEAATRVHLARIRVSWRATGIWRRFVKWAAAQSITRLLDGLRGSDPQTTGARQPQASCSGAAAPDNGPIPVLRH